MKKVTLKLNGMHCTSCSVLIDTVLEELDGVNSSKTNYVEATVEVEFNPAKIDVPQFISVIKSEGYEARVS